MIGSMVNESAPDQNSDILPELRRELKKIVPDPDPWLTTPHDLLGGKTPIEVASSGEKGKEVVENLIQLIKSGSFS